MGTYLKSVPIDLKVYGQTLLQGHVLQKVGMGGKAVSLHTDKAVVFLRGFTFKTKMGPLTPSHPSKDKILSYLQGVTVKRLEVYEPPNGTVKDADLMVEVWTTKGRFDLSGYQKNVRLRRANPLPWPFSQIRFVKGLVAYDEYGNVLMKLPKETSELLATKFNVEKIPVKGDIPFWD